MAVGAALLPILLSFVASWVALRLVFRLVVRSVRDGSFDVASFDERAGWSDCPCCCRNVCPCCACPDCTAARWVAADGGDWTDLPQA